MNFQELEQQSEVELVKHLPNVNQAPDTRTTIDSDYGFHTRSDSDDAQFEHVLEKLKRSSRRHGWFSTATTILGSLLAIVGGTGFLVILATMIIDGKMPQVVFDLSPTSFSFTGGKASGGAPTTATLSGITPLFLLAATSIVAYFMRNERTRLVSDISKYDDVRAIGPLISALYLRNKITRTQAAIKLKRLLPKMKQEDKDLLDKEQRAQMNLYLGRSTSALLPDDQELSLAILRAYSAIGDESEVPTVRRIAQGKGRSGKDTELRVAAQAYLDEVAHRQEKLKEPQTLLRSAEALGNDQSLLRPVEGVRQSDSDTLLRPNE